MRYQSKTEQWENSEFIRRGEIEKKERVKNQAAAMLRFIQIVADAIQEAGSHGIPSGHLYAVMMHKIDLRTYTYAIDILKESGAVTEQFHRLFWSGKRTIPTL
ncbi:MAG TPA: hypothetical protein P5175_06330 [Anaerohalosphaeraceae bacterium]|nr:hypothetical protein [Anaerohalosphaeraceae bacterium]HRS71452.1 hypothetical protein [Anaerohalosphaeraceae bacterium]